MKLLVIGSNSFSGSHFVNEALKLNHKVFGVSRSNQPNNVFLPYRWNKKNHIIILKIILNLNQSILIKI